MNLLSFDIPVLGSSYHMYIDYIKFTFNNDFIVFYNTNKNDPFITTLYKTRKNHTEIIQFLEDQLQSPIILEKINKYKHHISMDKNYDNIDYIVSMMRLLFPERPVSVQFMIYNDSYVFGRCSFHLLDLYEMGYLSLTSVDIKEPWYQRYNTHIFTGLLIVARNPFNKYAYDFIELNFFDDLRNDFLKLSFHMMVQDRPHMVPKLTLLIDQMVSTLPLKKEENIHKDILEEWKHYNDFEIKSTHFQIDLTEWKPCMFLKSLSKLLDMFPNYYISPRFNFDLRIH